MKLFDHPARLIPTDYAVAARREYRRQRATLYKELTTVLQKRGKKDELARLDDDVRRDFPDGLDTASTTVTRADLAVGRRAPDIELTAP